MAEEDVPRRALERARNLRLDLEVQYDIIPTAPFVFQCLEPSGRILGAFAHALETGLPWPEGMPLPVVTYHTGRDEWRIMDGMQRICAAQRAGFGEIPAMVASGETYDALEDILREGYYGEDFVEMLAMVSPPVRENLRLRDDMRLTGK